MGLLAAIAAGAATYVRRFGCVNLINGMCRAPQSIEIMNDRVIEVIDRTYIVSRAKYCYHFVLHRCVVQFIV